MKIVRTKLEADGFTLVEAMISMFFLAFIVADMGLVDAYAKRSTNLARRLSEANMIAEGILEKSRNTNYANLYTQFSSGDSPADPIMFDLNKDGALESYDETCSPTPNQTTSTTTVCSSAVGSYTVTRTITPFDPTTNALDAAMLFKDSISADVDVLVEWPDQKSPIACSTVPSINCRQVRVSTSRSKL